MILLERATSLPVSTTRTHNRHRVAMVQAAAAALAHLLPSSLAETVRAAALTVAIPVAAWLVLVLLRALACGLSPSHNVR